MEDEGKGEGRGEGKCGVEGGGVGVCVCACARVQACVQEMGALLFVHSKEKSIQIAVFFFEQAVRNRACNWTQLSSIASN